MGLLLAAGAQAQTYRWTSPEPGAWSDASRWLDSMSPLAGGGAAVALMFDNFGTTGQTANNDLGAPFVLNHITLAPRYGYAFGLPRTLVGLSLAHAPGQSLLFTGITAGLFFVGPASAAFDPARRLSDSEQVFGEGNALRFRPVGWFPSGNGRREPAHRGVVEAPDGRRLRGGRRGDGFRVVQPRPPSTAQAPEWRSTSLGAQASSLLCRRSA